jgi:hypothetical protein
MTSLLHIRVFFGHVSANLNPALCLADLVLGDSTFVEFLALSAAEVRSTQSVSKLHTCMKKLHFILPSNYNQMAGAFLGGVAVWLHWIPHFKTVPEPPAQNPADNLLRKRDALPKNAIEISSYQPHNPLSLLTLRRRVPRPVANGGASDEGQQGNQNESLLALRGMDDSAEKVPEAGRLPGGQILHR